MLATLYLLGCVLVPGQTPPRPQAPPPRAMAGSNWLLVPRLNRSQELVYRGTFREQGHGSRVQFDRAYRLETRIFVLDTPPRGAEIALLSILKHRPSAGGPPIRSEPPPASVRIERARVDLQGKLTVDAGVNLSVPVEGAPTLECGAFVALPGGRIAVGQEWMVVEGDQPPLLWRAVSTETIGGNPCIKLIGEQKSEDWDHPRGDRTAWRRQDTVWLLSQQAIAFRIERVIEQREPGHREATQRSVLRFELDSNMRLAGEAGDSRRHEITQALAFRDTLKPLLAQPARYEQHLTSLLKKIDYHLANQPETPYRAAVLQIKRRVEAARRGESPPEPIAETRSAPAVAAVGELSPNFLATDLIKGGAAQLRHFAGKPVLLVFYHPASPTTPAVLRFAQELFTAHARRINVVGLSISDKTDLVRRQYAQLGLSFPILSGGGMRASFAVESTPKMILIDSLQIVRGSYLGWGHETAGEVKEELRRWLPVGVSVPSVPAR